MLTIALLATLVVADPHVVYVNFDGVEIEACAEDDPETNCLRSGHGIQALPEPPFSVAPVSVVDSEMRATAVATARRVLADFAIRFTDVRPEPGTDYDMVVVGIPSPPPSDPHDNVSAYDCDDAAGPQIGFVWWDPNGQTDVTKVHLGNDIANTPAHGWGLDRVDSDRDMMGHDDPDYGIEPSDVLDECMPTIDRWDWELPAAVCPDQHLRHCSEPNEQNTYAELMEILGPSMPDLDAPIVEIIEPSEGGTVEPTFDLIVAVSDTQSPQQYAIDLALDGAAPLALVNMLGPEVIIPVEDLPVGEHVIVVAVTDEDGNPASDEVTFTVGGPGDTGTGDGTTGGSDTGSSGSSDGGDATGDSSDKGCGCASTPASAAPLLLLPLLYRRRRSC